MSQPQQQQLQQQSKITAFFTSRNSVLADEDKSLVAVKDAKSSKLQTFPPAKLPKTDAQHVTADGTKKKRQRKVTQPSDNKDKRLTPPLLPSSPTTAELATFSQKTRSSSRLNRTGDRDLAAFESTLQSETLTLSTITSTLDESANCQSSSAASELATAPKKRGRKKRKLDIDATESPQHQQLQHHSEMPKSDNENKGANHDDDGKNQPESENTNGTNSTTFTKKKGNDKNEMNAENLVAADVADSITTTTEMTLKSTASLQHQLTSSDDKLKQFSSSSSSSSSSSHSQSAQWPSMASFYGSLDHQKTATKAGVTSSSTLVIAASATTTTTTYQQTAQTTQPQPAALIKTGGKLLLTPKSLPSSTVDRLRTKLAEAAASQFSEAVQEDAVVVAESNTAKDDDDDSATEIDEPEKSLEPSLPPKPSSKTRQSRRGRNLRKSTRLAIYTTTTTTTGTSASDEDTEVDEDFLETAQTTSKRPRRSTAKRINCKAELENVDGNGSSGGDGSKHDGVRKKRPTKKKTPKGAAGADVTSVLPKLSNATTSTSATAPKTKTRKRKSVASKLAAKPSLSAEIPVITLESSDNEQREAASKTTAANQRPALPPPNYLKLWTSTYRPRSAKELVGQREAVDAARCWLANWQTTFAQPAISNVSLALPSYIQTNKSTATTTEMINANATTLGKCLLLCGPSGVGKTALVYALAGESGYQVLEFSATSQRLTPALVLKEMNDSLQSHYIAANHHHKDVINRNGNDNDNEHLSTAASATAATAKKLQGLNIFQRAKSGGNSADSAAGHRMQLSKSLILIDDIEGVLYEDYHGNSSNKQSKNDITKTRNTREKKTAELWRTLQTAIAGARKPIIITCSLRDGSFLFGGSGGSYQSNSSYSNLITTVQLRPVDWLPHLRSHLAGLLSSSITQKQIEETKKSNRKDDRCDEVDQKTVESTTTLKLSSARLDTGVYGRRFSGDVRQAVNQLQFWMAGKESGSSSSQGDTAPITSITSTPSSYLAYLDLCSVEDVYGQSLEGRRWAVSQDIDYYDAHLFDDRRLDFGGLHPLQSYQQNEHWKLKSLSSPLFLSTAFSTDAPLQRVLRDKGHNLQMLDEMQSCQLQRNQSQFTSDVVAFFSAVDKDSFGKPAKSQPKEAKEEESGSFADKLSSLAESAPTRRSKRLCTAKLSTSSATLSTDM